MPECREQYERLSRQRMLVRYDGRGCGLSDRDVDSYSIDSQILDLEAVVDALKLERFALMVSSHWGPVGIAYAARNPERVSELILWCCNAKGSDFFGGAQVEARIDLIRTSFELYSETTAHVLYGWSAGEPARRIAKLIRDSITQEALLAGDRRVPSIRRVRAPALGEHADTCPSPARASGDGRRYCQTSRVSNPGRAPCSRRRLLARSLPRRHRTIESAINEFLGVEALSIDADTTGKQRGSLPHGPLHRPRRPHRNDAAPRRRRAVATCCANTNASPAKC